MQLIDWLILLAPMLVVAAVGMYTRRYVRSVADFMAGGRNAGRYLLCTARAEMTAGAALFVALFEQFSKAGFTLNWWNLITVPISLLVAITGFVIYRYRQTRAMTLAQFFEMRYSRKFRLFAGVVGFIAGIVNFGVIPAVGARFFVYFLDLPLTLSLFSRSVPTYLVLMILFLGLATLLTTSGGQVTVLAVDCLQGMISQLFYVVIGIALVLMFCSATHTSEALLTQPPGQSMVNPFDTSKIHDFNLWFVMMGITTWIYGTMAWQNQHAFNSSAATPHDSRMGNILGRWRGFAGGAMTSILAVSTLIYLKHPDYASGASDVARAMEHIGALDPASVKSMYWPVALSHLLPAGIKGMFCAVILMGLISGDGMALHSWGSIFIQDIVVPLRKTPMTAAQHLLVLRLAVTGVALWALVFGAIFPQTEYLLLYWAVTQAIFVGGAGVAIIGGLYWSRGTTAGAWAGMITGSLLSTAGLLLRQFEPSFPLNGMMVSFFASLIAIGVYGVVSHLTCRQPHDMDRLLNRGKYAVEKESETIVPASVHLPRIYKWIGIDEHFSKSDRWITIGITGWSMFWFSIFAVGSVVYLIYPWSDRAWATYWQVTSIWLPLMIGVGTTIWFTIGCTVDMKAFFKRLKTETVDDADDGTVFHDASPGVSKAVSDTRKG